jgi:transcriptional regulator GlxA family with amidase domain
MNVLLPDGLDERILRVCRRVMERPEAELSVHRLAETACLSPYYFLRLFKALMKETPHHFVTRVRIEKAKDLLAGKRHSVTDICYMVGFESMGSISRIFHDAVGWTPSIYRSRVWEMTTNRLRPRYDSSRTRVQKRSRSRI